MIVLAGADLVLPDRVLTKGSLVLEDDKITAVESRTIDTPEGARRIDLPGCAIVPGFVDVHVHGVEGHDVLDGAQAIAEVAERLPRFGVTAFCPTSVACDPARLRTMLAAVADAQRTRRAGHAQVLSAHLESNFINPEYRGAQPEACLRRPNQQAIGSGVAGEEPYGGRDILDAISDNRAAVAIVTLAPELEGALDLVRDLVRAGHIVSIGHSGATFDLARAAIDAGVSHATHLFNRMSPMSHRTPGAPGAVLQDERVKAELICDGFHVHPAVMHIAIRAKGTDGIMAITDGTAGSGLPVGSRTRLGGQRIVVTERTAELEDGTLAGSILTMDGAFRTLVRHLGVSLVDAARLCATTPARQVGLRETGRIEVGQVADLAVLDEGLRIRQTFVQGELWRNPSAGAFV